MVFVFQYDNNEKLNDLIENNSDKFLIKVENLFNGNYATFTDEKPVETFENRIAILEKENKALKDELSQIQMSLASLIVTTLEEK